MKEEAHLEIKNIVLNNWRRWGFLLKRKKNKKNKNHKTHKMPQLVHRNSRPWEFQEPKSIWTDIFCLCTHFRQRKHHFSNKKKSVNNSFSNQSGISGLQETRRVSAELCGGASGYKSSPRLLLWFRKTLQHGLSVKLQKWFVGEKTLGELVL